MFDAQLYRDKAEVEAWRQKGPIGRLLGWLETNHMIHPEDAPKIDAEVDAEIAEAIAFAEAGTFEPVKQLTRFVYAESAAPSAAANR
jgi:pyruvate dehydrogenase E1 component alpha subunit